MCAACPGRVKLARPAGARAAPRPDGARARLCPRPVRAENATAASGPRPDGRSSGTSPICASGRNHAPRPSRHRPRGPRVCCHAHRSLRCVVPRGSRSGVGFVRFSFSVGESREPPQALRLGHARSRARAREIETSRAPPQVLAHGHTCSRRSGEALSSLGQHRAFKDLSNSCLSTERAHASRDRSSRPAKR